MSAELRVKFGRAPAAVRLGMPARGQDGGRPRGGAQPPPAKAQQAAAGKAATAGKPAAAGKAAVDAASAPRPAGATPALEPRAIPAAAPELLVMQGRFFELMRGIESKLDEFQLGLVRDVRELEPMVVDLAFAIAGRLLAREVERGRVDISDQVRAALDRVLAGQRDGHKLHVRVAPADRDLLGKVIGARIEDVSRIDFEVDPALKPLSCELRCDMRRVRVDLEQELERMRASVLGGGADA